MFVTIVNVIIYTISDTSPSTLHRRLQHHYLNRSPSSVPTISPPPTSSSYRTNTSFISNLDITAIIITTVNSITSSLPSPPTRSLSSLQPVSLVSHLHHRHCHHRYQLSAPSTLTQLRPTALPSRDHINSVTVINTIMSF